MSLISTKNEDGTPIQADSAFVPVLGGVVEGEIIYIGPYLDKDGNTVPGRGSVIIKQSNGAELRTVVFDPSSGSNTQVASGIFNRFWIHMTSKVLTDGERNALATDCQDNFDKLFVLMKERVLPKFVGVPIFHRVIFEESSKKDGKMYPKLGKKGNWLEIKVGDRATTLAYSEGKGETFSPVKQMVEAPVNNSNPFAS